jgi:hypothetical protein
MARKIYTNGCNVEAHEIILDGKKQWRWIVTSFIEDTFENGEDILVNEKGKKESDLFPETEPYIENDIDYLLNDDLYAGIVEFEDRY